MLLSKINAVVAIVFGLMLFSSANAAEEMTAYQMNKSSLNIKQQEQKSSIEKYKEKSVDQAHLEQLKQKKLTYIAQYFGIETEGKSINELREAIEIAKKENPEKWLLLKQEMQEIKLKLLEQKAKQSVK